MALALPSSIRPPHELVFVFPGNLPRSRPSRGTQHSRANGPTFRAIAAATIRARSAATRPSRVVYGGAAAWRLGARVRPSATGPPVLGIGLCPHAPARPARAALVSWPAAAPPPRRPPELLVEGLIASCNCELCENGPPQGRARPRSLAQFGFRRRRGTALRPLVWGAGRTLLVAGVPGPTLRGLAEDRQPQNLQGFAPPPAV